ncbi:alpha/beta hydrolase [Salinibacterium sp. NG253]|uniref:alpha/beta fold hydrolase n=1 Tax=Salinibacterium sp. NG253 TaxID=2792039 RepID=UPI0018CEACB2|nr:alpha/beta hydrolase [Salinibacterium sp. NG253]MBH0116789.1 alpha/beta hydrolase [Salinibacterium sp. NG253]
MSREELPAALWPLGDIAGNYVEVAGVRSYFESCGSGPAVLLLHTAGRDNRQWQWVMDLLRDEFTLYAPDLPGHGKSWPRHGEPCLNDVSEMADWLLEFMSAVGQETFLVAGTSLGGNLALLLPASSARVRGTLALQGADLTPTISETALDLMSHPQVSLPHSNMDFSLSLVGERAHHGARSFIEWGVSSLSPLAQQSDLRAYTRCDIRELMRNVTCPVIMAHGDRDWLVSRRMVDDTATRLINARSLEMVSLRGIGHFPHVESPLEVAALVRKLGTSVE